MPGSGGPPVFRREERKRKEINERGKEVLQGQIRCSRSKMLP
jgi:hypothetical protein